MSGGLDQIRQATMNALQKDKAFAIWRATEIEPDVVKKFATSEQGEQLSTEQVHKLIAHLFEGRAEYDGQTDTLLMKSKPTVALGLLPAVPQATEDYAHPCDNVSAQFAGIGLRTVRAVDASRVREGAVTSVGQRIRA
jgi:hypothetical protein